MRSPKVMGECEIRQFLLHLVEERMASRATVRQARATLTWEHEPRVGVDQRRSRTTSNELLVFAFDHHILSSASRPSGLRAWKR